MKLDWWEPVYTTSNRMVFSRIELLHGWLVKDTESNSICFVPKIGKDGW
jgi:hypothetical protein